MAARKLQQEIDKTFKKVAEGIEAFEAVYDKIQQCTNPTQKEKLEDNLKREIKKLQRQRDQIKTWAAGNEIKDKKPLLEQRKLIENEMEKFKAVEKEMKTKAFSKEGLSAAAKLDPKEKEKQECCQFLSEMVEELERQVETLEAEEEALQATAKKGKKESGKLDRLSEISRLTERHKWHQGKLELLLRALENGNVEPDQVNSLKDDISYYVNDNQAVEFNEDDTIYDDLNLEDEGAWGINNDGDRVSSQDNQSVQDEIPETADGRGGGGVSTKQKTTSVSESTATGRRPSNAFKSPLPALATLHAPMPSAAGSSSIPVMKPAPLPTRPAGETLKYASAAAAAAASEKTIAPLPPPPTTATASIAPLPPPPPNAKEATIASPSVAAAVPTPAPQKQAPPPPAAAETSTSAQASIRSPAVSQATPSSIPPTPALEKSEAVASRAKSRSPLPKQQPSTQEAAAAAASPEPEQPRTPSASGSAEDACVEPRIERDVESIYHLPPGLQDLIQSFEATRSQASAVPSPSVQRLLGASHATCPDVYDLEKPKHYRPQSKFSAPRWYPQEPSTIVDDAALYSRIDTDTLFYIFYYRQGTYQQFLAAKSLKSQSWRFHKQYQTWFQRHEEPKQITEEYEQGTYRFFDYESTWMNRRKADFKFAYKFLEDDL